MTADEIAEVDRGLTELVVEAEANLERIDLAVAHLLGRLRAQGTLACDPEYAEYRRWLETADV